MNNNVSGNLAVGHDHSSSIFLFASIIYRFKGDKWWQKLMIEMGKSLASGQ